MAQKKKDEIAEHKKKKQKTAKHKQIKMLQIHKCGIIIYEQR